MVSSNWSWATRGQGDASHLVGGLDEPRAVEAKPGGLTSPHIVSTDLGEGPVDSDPRGSNGGDCLCLGLVVGLREVEDLGDVGVGVVLGENGSAEVGPVACSVGA